MKIPVIGWIGRKLRGIFLKAKPLAEVAVKTVDILKAAVESPHIKRLVDLTKTTNDDKVLEALRVWLPKVAVEMGLVNSIVSGISTEQVIRDLIARLQIKNENQRSYDWANLAALIYRAMADEQITIGEAMSITQEVYRAIKSQHP